MQEIFIFMILLDFFPDFFSIHCVYSSEQFDKCKHMYQLLEIVSRHIQKDLLMMITKAFIPIGLGSVGK
jgi:hypothetical protein